MTGVLFNSTGTQQTGKQQFEISVSLGVSGDNAEGGQSQVL